MMIYHRPTFVLILSLLWLLPARAELEIAELPTDQEVLFSRDIAPVLKKNCVACHNQSEEEGGVNLETVDKMRSSDVDDVLVPGKPDASRLFLLAAHLEEPVMPPEDNDVSASSLRPMELALLKRWIENGAKVDKASMQPSEVSFQPLPPALRTNYSSATTPGGRLSVVSFGNRIQVFGSASPLPLASLEHDQKPAHDDFVQDVWIDPSGRRIISSGFRNVKFWEMQLLESVAIPDIDLQDTLAVSMNRSGRHVAVLSRRGELSVAIVGTNRWHWMKGFDLPESWQADGKPDPILALDDSGDTVAVGAGTELRVVSIDRKQVDVVSNPNALTAIRWAPGRRLVTGDSSGTISVWTRNDESWAKQDHQVFQAPVQHICGGKDKPQELILVDATGNVSVSNAEINGFESKGKLPTPAAHAIAFPSGAGLWFTGPSGALAKFDLDEKKSAELSKTNPVAAQQYESHRWDALVGERLVAANEKDLGQAQANVTAEEKSLETITKTIETKTKDRDDKKKASDDAQKAAQAAVDNLAKAKEAETKATAERTQLEASIKKLDASIAELEKQLAELKKNKLQEASKLAAIPDAKKLAEAVKAATEASAKATKEAETKKKELDAAVEALKSSEETKGRGEARLKGLAADAERWKTVVDASKAEQAKRKESEAAAKANADQSKAAGRGLAVVSGGTQLIVGSETQQQYNVWSGSGDWLANVSELEAGAELVASGDAVVLVKGKDGAVSARRTSPTLWSQTRVLGSAAGESPFADRVLCIDVDPSGRLMATGGGHPSRSGELMIWNLADGRLVHRFEKPHSDTVTSLCFSPDGKTLATGGADRMVKLWDVETWDLIKTLEGHTHHVTAIDWNVNLRQLASGSADATVKVWDIETGKATRTISGLKSEVTKLVYVGRDDRVGITCGDGYFRVYRTDNGRRETNVKLPGGYLYALDANDEGTRFVVGGATGSAVVVDKAGKQLVEYGEK